MAKVKRLGPGRYAVTHDTTGAVLERDGKKVIHPTKAEAQADARATRRRVMGKPARITPKRRRMHR